MNTINEQIEKKLARRIFDQLDTEALIKELAPQISKEIAKGILAGLKDLSWGDLVNDAIYSNHADLEIFLLRAIGIPLKEKKSR